MITYSVPGMHCGHCRTAMEKEISTDLDSKLVTVVGEDLSDGALRAAIEEAGYEAV